MRSHPPRSRRSRQRATPTSVALPVKDLPGIEIHPLRDRADCLFTLAAWLYREWFEPVGDSEEDALQTMIERMNRFALPMAFVATEREEPVGMASLSWSKCPAGWETACLAGLYVIPEKRTQGIGSRLCRWAMQQAADLGLSSLSLFTPDQTRFYHRLGWTPAGTKNFRGHSSACAYMHSPLLPHPIASPTA